MFSESDRPTTGRDRKIPSDLFRQLHDSYSELSRKLVNELASPREIAGVQTARRNTRAIDTHGFEEVPNSTDSHSTFSFSQGDDESYGCSSCPAEGAGGSEDSLTFTIALDDPVVAEYIEAMSPAEKRLLLCRASNRDPNTCGGPAGFPWIRAVTQNPLEILTIHCHTPAERGMLQEGKKWQRRFPTFVAAEMATYEVLMEDVQRSSIHFQATFPDYMAARMLASVNVPLMTTLNRPEDLRSVRWLTPKEDGLKPTITKKRGKSCCLVIEFLKPEQANEAIRQGLEWDGQVYTCFRIVKDDEIKHCENCQKFEHTASGCNKNAFCRRCFGDHSTSRCLNTVKPCQLCGMVHKSDSKECCVKLVERLTAKARVRSREPFFPTSEDAGPARRSTLNTFDTGNPEVEPLAPDRELAPIGETIEREDYREPQPRGSTQASTALAGAQSTSASHSSNLPADDSEALLDQIDRLRDMISARRSMSPAPQAPTQVLTSAPSRKRKAIKSPPAISPGSWPEERHKRSRHQGHPTSIKEDDPVERYIRENSCVPVEEGSLRDGLLRAGKIAGPPICLDKRRDRGGPRR